jgi:hypothetical protein
MSNKLEDDENWDGVAVKQAPDPKKRLAELQAKAPVKGRKIRPFARVYLNTAARAFTALKSQKAMVWVWLVHRTWKRQSQTVTVPSGELAKLGVLHGRTVCPPYNERREEK